MNDPGFLLLGMIAIMAIILVSGIAVVMTLRQAIGTRLTGYQIYRFRNDIYSGLLAALFAIATPVVLYVGITPRLAVAIVSGAIAVIATCYAIVNVARILSYGGRVGFHLWLTHLGRIAIALSLIVHGLGLYINGIDYKLFAAPLSPITLAAAWELLTVCFDFALILPMVGSEPKT